jgi:flagellar motor protein MotB
MLGFSYYDGLDNLLKDSNKKDNTDLQNKPSSIFKLTNSQSNQSKNTSSQEKYSIAHLSQKLKEDMPKLERFIKDREYRKKLENSFYPRYNPELFDIIGLQELVKEKKEFLKMLLSNMRK